uniref:MYND-type domain-containing protein n=1 Tax=Acrobeloides nanus TaxID=290746 RepID=A0A914D245_9BILA
MVGNGDCDGSYEEWNMLECSYIALVQGWPFLCQKDPTTGNTMKRKMPALLRSEMNDNQELKASKNIPVESGVDDRDNHEAGDGWVLDDRMRRMLMELQRHWLGDYRQSREKVLVEITERIHTEFLADQQKTRTELLTQFKDELDTMRQNIDATNQEEKQMEIDKREEQHRKDISVIKKKQWCWQCESEAIYFCCWNTSYCSVECQQKHWAMHTKYCKRKRPQGQRLQNPC